MADTSTFPTITGPIHNDGPCYQFTASGAIKRGMVVAFATTGVSNTVLKCIAGTTAQPIGVAITDAADGEEVTVALTGSIVTVCEGTGTAVDAGEMLSDDDAAVGGCVKTAVTTATGYGIGISLEDISANGTGKMLICPQIITKAAS